MRSHFSLIAAGILVFAAVAALLIGIMPSPLSKTDSLLIGSVSTLAALMAVFLTLISTRLKAKDLFFKKRRKR